MTRALFVSIALLLPLLSGSSVVAQEGPPPWAYPVNPPDFKPAPDDGTLRRVPDSSAGYTLTQIRDLFVASVWHPGDHPPLPGVVGMGRKPEVRACGVCHRADGPGGPENSGLAGLPATYIVQQMADFKSGARTSSVPQRVPVKLMISLAKEATDAEVEVAAAYFAALKPKAIMKVVETDTVPKSYVFGWHLAATTTGEKEPLGQRIIEVPENLEHFESRDSRSRFVCVRAHRQRREGTNARGHRRREDGAMRDLPRSGTERRWTDPADRRPLAQLLRAAALRLQDRCPGRRRQRAYEAEC